MRLCRVLLRSKVARACLFGREGLKQALELVARWFAGVVPRASLFDFAASSSSLRRPRHLRLTESESLRSDLPTGGSIPGKQHQFGTDPSKRLTRG